MNLNNFSLVPVLLGLLLADGCASAPPETVSTDASVRTTVTVFPIFDIRENKTIKLGQISRNANLTRDFLSDFYLAKYKNVRREAPHHPGAELPVPEDEFASGKWTSRPEFSGGVSRYCLLTYLTDLRYTGANASVVASLRMYLLDCDKKEVIWRKSAFDETWLGLVGGSIERAMSSKGDSPQLKSLNAVINECMEAFPYLKKEPPPAKPAT